MALYLVCQALQEGGLQLGHKRFKPRSRFGNEQAQGVQDGRLDLPSKAVANDADEGTCRTPDMPVALANSLACSSRGAGTPIVLAADTQVLAVQVTCNS